MSNFEKKFGKYALPNLTVILIGFYAIGYVMTWVNASFLDFLTLDVYKIVMHGQIWRIVSWVLVPPDDLGIFTLIMLYFYYNIGTVMERTLGTYKYNVYIFRGLFLTILAAFLCFALCYFFPNAMLTVLGASWKQAFALQGEWPAEQKMIFLAELFSRLGVLFSTYYINISIFLAFAIIYPEMQVLLMFMIPVKVKWMGILDLIVLVYEFFTGNVITMFAVGAALLNIAIFYATYRHLGYLRPSQIKRRAEFQHKVRKATSATRHKCTICGQTEQDHPDLEFRFCSKCNGNYEYCSEHLYTHTHVK